MLSIKKLNVSIDNKNILHDLNIEIKSGEIHAMMGPNGSGKSTLATVITGRKNYNVTNGSLIFNNKNLLELSPEERAHEGIFMAFQYPVEIPGLSNKLFLHTAVNAIRKYRNEKELDRFEFNNFIKDKINFLKISADLLTRSVNVGFSGGEKKLNDILQMSLLEPKLCILDETDSGLDIDALKNISGAVNLLRSKQRSFILITHYQRILNYIRPDWVHVLYQGKIIKSGDFSLVKQLEEKGYGWLTEKQ
ncbi:MAG: Fe-S cluster assembly ATPase SufC [Pantoea sp. Brub]|nr:Fe-S cluster assembly ATPase SufC [Pantoea sp. Brub]